MHQCTNITTVFANLEGWKMLSENGNYHHILIEEKRLYLCACILVIVKWTMTFFFGENLLLYVSDLPLLTVEHILLECPDFNVSRGRYLLGHSLQTVIGDNVDNFSRLFLFLQAIWRIQPNLIFHCFMEVSLQP